MKKCILFLLLISILALTTSADLRAAIREDWLGEDTQLISDTLGGLARIGSNRPISEGDLVYLGLPCQVDKDLGFGGRVLHHRRPGGYTAVTARVLLFESHVAYLELELRTSESSWNKIDKRIMEIWESRHGPACQLTYRGVIYRWEDTDRYNAFRTAVEEALGARAEVKVPRRFADDYRSLISPMTSYTIGLICSDGGSRPSGNTAIERLAKKKRWPLIKNILRGHNPEGRVYAALALLRAERHGRNISPEVRTSIGTVLSLHIPLNVCHGCMVSSRYAAGIVTELLDSFDRHWDRF